MDLLAVCRIVGSFVVIRRPIDNITRASGRHPWPYGHTYIVYRIRSSATRGPPQKAKGPGAREYFISFIAHQRAAPPRLRGAQSTCRAYKLPKAQIIRSALLVMITIGCTESVGDAPVRPGILLVRT